MATNAQAISNPHSSSSVEPRPLTLKPNASAQDGASSGSSTSIAANDFLTLLVTEMKNQDPTATTDPNEYVNQLVQVNSLQQLISINETLQKATTVDATTYAATGMSSERSYPAPITVPEANGTQAGGESMVAAAKATPTVGAAASRIATALTSR